MAKAPTQYEVFRSTLRATSLRRELTHVPGATRGSRLAYRLAVAGFGTFYLAADGRRITKVITPGRTWIRPNSAERATIFEQIAAVDTMIRAGAKALAA